MVKRGLVLRCKRAAAARRDQDVCAAGGNGRASKVHDFLARPLRSAFSFQADNGETELARQLFERLLERTQHFKVRTGGELVCVVGGARERNGCSCRRPCLKMDNCVWFGLVWYGAAYCDSRKTSLRKPHPRLFVMRVGNGCL